MRARFVFEKFTEDGDPISDMGIGIMRQIEDWFKEKLKTGEIWFFPNMKNTNDILNRMIHSDTPDDFIEYMLTSRTDYDKNYILNRFTLNDKNKKFIDYLLNKGAKFEDLYYKSYYTEKLNGKETSLSLTEKVAVACYTGNYKMFKDLIKNGAKVTIGMINSLLSDFDYKWKDFYKTPEESDKILQYIKDNIDNLEEIIHPKDHKKLDKIRSLLQIKKSVERGEYPRGYKIYRVLKYIDENHPTTRKEIAKFIVELTFGKGTFNPFKHNSYWSDAFGSIIYPRLQHTTDKSTPMCLNFKGKKDLDKFEKKFGSMKIKALI